MPGQVYFGIPGPGYQATSVEIELSPPHENVIVPVEDLTPYWVKAYKYDVLAGPGTPFRIKYTKLQGSQQTLSFWSEPGVVALPEPGIVPELLSFTILLALLTRCRKKQQA